MNTPPRRLSALSASWVLATKDLKVALTYRLSFLLGHVTVFGSLIVFYFVSRVVGQSKIVGSPDEYFRFVVVGMALGSLVETVVGASMGAARRDQVEGTLEAVASLPVGSGTLGLGWLLYPLLDALIGVVVTLVLAIPLGMSGAHVDLATTVVALALSVVVFASLGFIGAAIVLAFQQGAGVVPLGLSVMALLSGTLFPVSVMPSWLRTLSNASPLRHALDSTRGAILDAQGFHDLATPLITLAIFAAVLAPVGVVALELGLRRARRVGGLARF